MKIEQIGIHADAIEEGFLPVALRPNKSISPVLFVTSFRQQGYLLELRDPYGAPVWAAMLNGEGAIDPEFGKDYLAAYESSSD